MSRFHLFIYSFVRSFVRSSVRPSIHPSIHPSVHLFIYLFIYSCENIFTSSWKMSSKGFAVLQEIKWKTEKTDALGMLHVYAFSQKFYFSTSRSEKNLKKRMWIGIPIMLPHRFHKVLFLREYVTWFWLPDRECFVDTSNFCNLMSR